MIAAADATLLSIGFLGWLLDEVISVESNLISKRSILALELLNALKQFSLSAFLISQTIVIAVPFISERTYSSIYLLKFQLNDLNLFIFSTAKSTHFLNNSIEFTGN